MTPIKTRFKQNTGFSTGTGIIKRNKLGFSFVLFVFAVCGNERECICAHVLVSTRKALKKCRLTVQSQRTLNVVPHNGTVNTITNRMERVLPTGFCVPVEVEKQRVRTYRQNKNSAVLFGCLC